LALINAARAGNAEKVSYLINVEKIDVNAQNDVRSEFETHLLKSGVVFLKGQHQFIPLCRDSHWEWK
jgi:hypothetical protein